ncbi:hypothetical protein [Dermacoccus nishinomiyaensis]|uniref:hypothetical protein n=1 Tax=Dermacoccus nishinomiyaensis TaxID=1274 RepID=UPI00093D0886|nr:hypothetical protein [Dermacoccus nishinomiyaensis]
MDDGPVRLDNFSPENYLGNGTVLQRDVSKMPLDSQSATMAKFMWDISPFQPNGAFGSKTSLNTSKYGTHPVHTYVVDSSHPDMQWAQLDGVSGISGATEYENTKILSGLMPIMDWMHPARMGDQGFGLYDLGTGIMREYFGMVHWEDGTWSDGGRMPAYGGYSQNSPGLRNLAKDNYGLQQKVGIATVSGMHNSIGFIGITEALGRKINHALCFTLASARSWQRNNLTNLNQLVSWPSRLSDGKLERYIEGDPRRDPNRNAWTGIDITPTHGQWARLKADVDPMHNPRTSRPYKPLTRVLIDAAKTYGLVATDTNLWCHAFNGEQGLTWEQTFGQDPWTPGGPIEKMYREDGLTQGSGLEVDDFPWDRTEWAPLDWGRPSPDWNIRPGTETNRPWWSPTDPNRPSWK